MAIAFLRSHPYKSDGRLSRYLKICQEHSVDYLIFDWDRDRSNLQAANEVCLSKVSFLFKAKTGAGFSNIFNLFLWNLFLLYQLILQRKKYKHIHAADLDTLLPAILVSKFFNKHLIFDIYDKYSAARKMPRSLARVFDWFEFQGIKIANDVILPHSCRVEQLGINNAALKSKLHIFENTPLNADALSDDIINPDLIPCLDFINGYEICLSYVGILESQHRGLENLIQAISHTPNIGLIIAGSGELIDFVRKSSSNSANILFVGRVNPQDAHHILNATSIHVGFYYKSIPNHIYASPNKYYEHLYYGKPLLTNCGVPPGVLVKTNDTGYVIDETYEAVLSMLNDLDSNDIKLKGKRAKQIWNEQYANYTRFLSDEYQKIIKDA